ncbi:MAG: carboxypeptidase-like regulatory domain-containing protein, partial [Prevotella sp.]
MRRTVLLFVLSLMLSLSASAQSIITGRVIDDNGKALPSVIVKRYGPQHKMRGYAMSKADGAFSITAEVGDSLNFSMLGLKSQTFEVKDNMKPLTVRMSSGAIELKEVKVKSDRVHEHGDTTTYIVGAYANSNDRSIGDVIAKMPGFDVDKSTGKI